MKKNVKKIKKENILNVAKASKTKERPIFDKLFLKKKNLPIYLSFLFFLIIYVIQFFSNKMFLGRIIFGLSLFIILGNLFK